MRILILGLFLLFSKTSFSQGVFGSFDRSYYGLAFGLMDSPESGGMFNPAEMAAERYLSEKGYFYQRISARLAFGDDWFIQEDGLFDYDGHAYADISSYWYATPNPGWPLSLHLGGGPGLALLTEFEDQPLTYLYPTIGFSPALRLGEADSRVQVVFAYNFKAGPADFQFEEFLLEGGINVGLSFLLDQ